MSRPGVNPCLLCDEPTRGPKGGVVCGECRRKVRDYEKQRDLGLQDRVAIRLPQYPYVPGRGHRVHESACEALDRLLRELRSALPMPAARDGFYTLPAPGETAVAAADVGIECRIKRRHEERDFMVFNAPKELAQFLIDLEPAIQNAIYEAKASGISEGTDLLAQLAAGKLTSEEFDRKAGITPRGA